MILISIALNKLKDIIGIIFLLMFVGCAYKNTTQPNIIIIFTDDQGYADVGCFGAEGFETPHLDRLARQGVTYSNASSVSSWTLPTHATMLTGLYPAFHRVQEVTRKLPGST